MGRERRVVGRKRREMDQGKAAKWVGDTIVS